MEQQENELERGAQRDRRGGRGDGGAVLPPYGRRAQGGRIQAGPGPACFWTLPGRRPSWPKTAPGCRTRPTLNITRISSARRRACPCAFQRAVRRAWGRWPIRAWRARSATLPSPACSSMYGRRRIPPGRRCSTLWPAATRPTACCPLKNSHAGDVSEVLDLCYAHRDICVCDVYDLPVSQNLPGVPGAHLSDVKKAVSHPQALQQSAKFIRSLGLETQAFQNTAAAAKSVAEAGDKSVAAIASLETAALYGLSVLAENINTSETNTTRFIVIGRRMNATCGQPVQPVVHCGPPGGPAGPW